jgi:hypothetical protein
MKNVLIFLITLSCLLMYGCGGNTETTETSSETTTNPSGEESSSVTINGEPKTVDEAMGEVRKALQGDGELKEVVDFRELKKLLPERVLKMDRTDYSGEKAGAFGMNMAVAKATYEEGDRRVEVNIVDFAGITGALMGMASWATVEVDRESDDGYERTTTIDGYKAFEKYNTSTKDGELNVIVEDRFIVSIDGNNLSEKEFKKVLEVVNIKKLARMK